MPQQINLCTPILLTQKRYFSAQNMVQALAVFVVLGGGLCAYWTWSLNAASEGFKKTVATQGKELESLQAAIRQSKAGLGPVESALAKELQAGRAELLQRERLYDELQRGLFQPGWGHSARLQLLAQSIPTSVWVTEINTDANQLEVSGFTLEPAALNDWVRKLGASPLLLGQKLSTVRVESTSAAIAKTGAGTAVATPPQSAASSAAQVRAAPPMWSFSLVSAVADSSSVSGGKP